MAKKSKGWLDNYGEEANANEGHSSASKEWIGEGYSTQGRNYSPAWGGQFEEGGEIPQAQKGRRTPVYVNDPNDPRLRLYNDSVSVFRASQNPWFWQGTKVTTKQDYEKKDKLDNAFPMWSFDEDQYKKDKKKGIFKDFNDYVYDTRLVEKGDRRATDAFNRNVGKDYEDLKEPVEKKLPDGRIKQIWGKYKGKLDDSHYEIYDPVTGSISSYTNPGDGSPHSMIRLYNPNIKPISHTYRAFENPQSYGGLHISSEDSEYVNKVLKNKSKKKKDYTNYTYGTTDVETYKEPVQPVIYNKKKYNPDDPRLKQLQESFDKFHGGIKGNVKGKEQPKPQTKEEPSLKKKVIKVEPKSSSSKSTTPQLRTIEHPNIEISGSVPQGQYRTSYYDPQMKDWNERAFMTQQESDQFADEMSKRGYPGAYGNVTQRVQYQLGGNVYPVNYVPQAQNGITSEDSMLNSIYSKWPALKKLGNVSIKADESFTRDKTGVGDIEFFSPNTPQITYSNGYVAQNPGVDSYGILYNPSTNDEQNIRLDMLHGMAEADPRYRRLRNRFERAVGHTDIKNEMNHWYNIDKEKGNAEDGREKWMDNYTDGQLRTLLYEGDRSKQNYSDEEANQLLSNPRVKRKFNKLNNYLQKGELAMGASIPGSVGFTYARTNSPAPSEGPYAKKTLPSAQNGMTYYQHGLDWKPKTISKNGGWLDKYNEGGVIKDDMGQWAHPGEITEIGSNNITMQGVPYPVLGISDTGHTQMMFPGEDYKFKGKKVTEFPMAQNGYTTDPADYRRWQDSVTKYNEGIEKLTQARKDIKHNIGVYSPLNGLGSLATSAVNFFTSGDRIYPKYSERTIPYKKRWTNDPYVIEPIADVEVGDKKFYNNRPSIGDYSAINDMDTTNGELFYTDIYQYAPPVRKNLQLVNPQKKVEKPKPTPPPPSLKRKPVKMETIKSKSSTSTPGIKTMTHTSVEQKAVPQRGEYRVSYYNPDIKDWSEQAFETEKESDKFADEMSKRGYGGSYGNVTQTRKVNKKENGGWLSQYK